MAITITNVFVKDVTSGETEYTERDSVYANGSLVFAKEQQELLQVPMGIIPLRRISGTGSLGPCVTLCSQSQMDKDLSEFEPWGFLFTPVVYQDAYYESDKSSYVLYATQITGDHSYSVDLPRNGNSEWNRVTRQVPPEGSALFTNTLAHRLYMLNHPAVFKNEAQVYTMYNRLRSPLTAHYCGYLRIYSKVRGNSSAPDHISVYTGTWKYNPTKYTKVKSLYSATSAGIKFSSTQKLFV